MDKDEVKEVQDDVRGKRPMEQPSKTAMSKRPRQKGPIGMKIHGKILTAMSS